MTFLTKPELHLHLQAQFNTDEDRLDQWRTEQSTAPLPPDAGKRNSMAVATATDCTLPALLYVAEIGVWPSSENRPLAAAVRSAFGEQRDPWEAPACTFAPGETDALIALLGVSLLCFWDTYLISAAAGYGWFFSHDDFVASGPLSIAS